MRAESELDDGLAQARGQCVWVNWNLVGGLVCLVQGYSVSVPLGLSHLVNGHSAEKSSGPPLPVLLPLLSSRVGTS